LLSKWIIFGEPKKKDKSGGEDEKKVHKMLHRFVLSIINLMSA